MARQGHGLEYVHYLDVFKYGIQQSSTLGLTIRLAGVQ